MNKIKNGKLKTWTTQGYQHRPGLIKISRNISQEYKVKPSNRQRKNIPDKKKELKN